MYARIPPCVYSWRFPMQVDIVIHFNSIISHWGIPIHHLQINQCSSRLTTIRRHLLTNKLAIKWEDLNNNVSTPLSNEYSSLPNVCVQHININISADVKHNTDVVKHVWHVRAAHWRHTGDPTSWQRQHTKQHVYITPTFNQLLL